MSGLKNSPFGKRLRASHQDPSSDDDPLLQRQAKTPRPSLAGNPIFGFHAPSTSTTPTVLDSARSSSPDRLGHRSESPVREHKDYGDRFVPSRDAGDMRTTYNLMEEYQYGQLTPSKRGIPSESDALKEQANSIFTSILHSEMTPSSPSRSRRPSSPTRSGSSYSANLPSTPTRRRIFAYHSPSGSNPTTPTSSRRLDSPNSPAYSLSPIRPSSASLLSSPRRLLRSVCKTPYRVLDAPELADDFYLNLVDWSSTNVLGVGLGACAYLWTAHNAAVSKLCDYTSQNDTISSLSWVQKGSTLAIGTMSGKLHIYDAHEQTLLRSYTSPVIHGTHTQRIGALAWNAHVVSSGSRDRSIHHRDVRDSNPKAFKKHGGGGNLGGHKQEVCGLKWSGDGGPGNSALASGGNDNKVCIWDLRGSRRGSASAAATPTPDSGNGPTGSDMPLWKFHEHTAAVKALAWDPHVSGVLATGGGTQDKHIRFWNVLTGSMLNELDTGSQVCNLIWSKTSHELVSTHGFSSSTAQNQICIWKYPSLSMVASLTGHSNRVLYLAMSPDGETIVTGAGDETLRFWNAFPKKEICGPGGAGEIKSRDSKLDHGKLIR